MYYAVFAMYLSHLYEFGIKISRKMARNIITNDSEKQYKRIRNIFELAKKLRFFLYIIYCNF